MAFEMKLTRLRRTLHFKVENTFEYLVHTH
jgi:hypothetical protein